MELLEELAKSRRQEHAIRIASQRAMNIRLREKVQESKVAFDRLKQGLCPKKTDKIVNLRRRWRGKRRVKRQEAREMEVEHEYWDDVDLPVKKPRHT